MNAWVVKRSPFARGNVASIITRSYERPSASNRSSRASVASADRILAANVDEPLGGQALSVRQGQRGVDHHAVVRAPLGLQPVEPRQRGVVNGVNLAGHRLAAWVRHDDREAGPDHLVDRYGDGFAQELGGRVDPGIFTPSPSQ